LLFPILTILLVPFAFVFVTYFASSRLGSKVGWLAFLALAYSTLSTLLAGFQGGVAEYYGWHPIGLFGLSADGLSIPMLFTISLLCTLISLY
jgi:NADH:ubiquinone oxidoreductase subunit 5 (subunit L)/multisubunit Na+/H+ antiporter MnhA subunit